MADQALTATTFAKAFSQAADPGTDFHRFVTEVFAVEAGGLTSFLARGKDGAIDLYDAHDGCVWECKFVGADGIDAIRPRWMEVARHLRDNLLPDQPKAGQSQYQPWYDSDRPIRRYRFCVSSRLNNQAQAAVLESEISNVFSELAQRNGLSHLASIAIEVWSWDRFEPELANRPQMRLRWFNTNLPAGVQEFSRSQERTPHGFQPYLHGTEKIRYVSVNTELEPVAVLHVIAQQAQLSSVVHGRGGAGKSRLMLEVGRAALAAGWVVFIVQPHTTPPEALHTLVRAAGEASVLVLMDYVERCVGWDAWLLGLQDLTDAGARVKLLGNCRSSWVDRLDEYQTRRITLPEDLPEIVQCILAQRTGLVELAEACRGVPVFAAFLCFLADTGQEQALASLRRQKDFNRWLQAHIARWPGMGAIPQGHDESALVELLVNLPCSDDVMHSLEEGRPSVAAYRQQLVQDGWIDNDISAPEGEQWAALHDVLADGALLRWLGLHRPSLAEPQMLRWLQGARQRNNLTVVLRAMQRVARESSMQALAWHKIFESGDAGAWEPWRDAILATGLMTPLAAISWLEHLSEGPSYAVASAAVQLSLADAVETWRRQTGAEGSAVAAMDVEARLTRWLDAAAAALTGQGVPLAAKTPNRALVQALRWLPQRYAAAADRWMQTHHDEEQAQFMLNAWLQQPIQFCTLEPARLWCRSWLRQHHHRPSATFVFQAWLKAHGDPTVIEEGIRGWLAMPGNATSSIASFVFEDWLDKHGDKLVIQDAMLIWLGFPENAVSLEAHFVLRAWLMAGGNKALVQDAVLGWLAVPSNAISPSATYVIRAWLSANGDKALVQDAVLGWLAIPDNARSPTAQYVLTAWLSADGDTALVQGAVLDWLAVPGNAVLPSANFLFAAWLDANGALETIEAGCQIWFATQENAVSGDAGYLIRAYGDRLKRLPEWLWQPAGIWLQAWRHSPEAVYPLKYIAGIPALGVDTAQAVTDWCLENRKDPDAIFRLARLGRQMALIPNRATLVRGVLDVVELTVGTDSIQGSHAILSCLSCIAMLWRLPARNAMELQAMSDIAPTACRVFSAMSDIPVPDLDAFSHDWIDYVVSADWERMVQLGVDGGIPWNAKFQAGVAIWTRCCRPWAPNTRVLSAFDRLLAKALVPKPGSSPNG